MFVLSIITWLKLVSLIELSSESIAGVWYIKSTKTRPTSFLYLIIYWKIYINLILINIINEKPFLFFFWQTDEGVKNLSPERAEKLAGSDPDYNNRMLYNAIANGKHVSNEPANVWFFVYTIEFNESSFTSVGGCLLQKLVLNRVLPVKART